MENYCLLIADVCFHPQFESLATVFTANNVPCIDQLPNYGVQ